MTPQTLRDGGRAERPERLPHRRSSDKLLTLDRALLAGTFAIGCAWATTQVAQGNLQSRVEALEKSKDTQVEKIAEHNTELAVIRERLDGIQTGLTSLAESVTHFVNVVPDRDQGRRER